MIVNPVVGNGRGLDDFPLISRLLREAGIHAEPVFTEHKFHATELTVTAVREGWRRILVVGGDGTLHEVVNGLFIQQVVPPAEVLLAMVPVGTDSDWARSFGTSNRYQDAVRNIAEGCSFLQDVGVVSYEEAHFRQTRYVVGVAGMGFDARLLRRITHLEKAGRAGFLRRLLCVLRTYFGYKATGVKIWVDGHRLYNGLLFSIALGICKYNGGVNQLPDAVADDGLWDISLVKPIHFWHVLFRLRYLYNGDIYRIRHVRHSRGSRIRIESSPEISLEADGELLGETPFEFSILPRAIRVVVSRSFYERSKGILPAAAVAPKRKGFCPARRAKRTKKTE